MTSALDNFFKKTAQIESHELRAVLVSFVYLFCLMASYYTMRPLRDALASEVASEDLKYLWTGTFIASTLAAVIFGWVVSRYKIASALPWIYGFFIINIGIFYALMAAYPLGSPDTMTAPVLNAWPIVMADTKVSLVVACIYYVWLSVFNMFVVSVFWSFLADRYTKDQSKRLFGFVAAGGSAGAALGPLATAAIVTTVGVENMLLIAAIVLSITLVCIYDLTSQTEGGHADVGKAKDKLGGSSWSGFSTLFKDPYLMAIAVFVMLYTFISTIFYVAQVDLVRAAFDYARGTLCGQRHRRRHRQRPGDLHPVVRHLPGRRALGTGLPSGGHACLHDLRVLRAQRLPGADDDPVTAGRAPGRQLRHDPSGPRNAVDRR